jgi:RNA polymerase sigma-32 factor
VKRFDPERGFRLATYAMWWIRASIQEYILHSWSLVKMGTTAAQKKLFFNLRKLKRELDIIEDGDLTPEAAKTIAERLNVREDEVIEMNRRLTGADQSLNVPVAEDGATEWQDWVEEESEGQESLLGEAEELRLRRDLLQRAMAVLTARERRIIDGRRLSEIPKTLDELAREYGITRERVRQIEQAAILKLEKGVKLAAQERAIRRPH